VGVHQTTNLNDGYMGSGKLLKAAIIKYGIENFLKTVLETFETKVEMFAKEKEIVTEQFISRKDTYNLRIGGSGGGNFKDAEHQRKCTDAARGLGNASIKRLRAASESYDAHYRKQRKDLMTAFARANPDEMEVRQRRITEAARAPAAKEKRKQTFAEIQHQAGENNSQFGSMWITNGKISKKIKKDETIPEGWYRGRNTEIVPATRL